MNSTISHHRQQHTDATMGKLIGDLSKSLQTVHPNLSAEEATRVTREIQPDRSSMFHATGAARRAISYSRSKKNNSNNEYCDDRIHDDSSTRGYYLSANSSARNLYTMRSIDENAADGPSNLDDNASACSCDSSSPRP